VGTIEEASEVRRVPYRISIELLDAMGKVCERQPLSHRFDAEGAVRIKADELAGAYPNRRYVEQGGFWECSERDGTRSRIVIYLA
jgi:hypothetical protein